MTPKEIEKNERRIALLDKGQTIGHIILILLMLLLANHAFACDSKRPDWVDLLSYEKGEHMYFVNENHVRQGCDIGCARHMAVRFMKTQVREFMGLKPYGDDGKTPPIRKLKLWDDGKTAYVLARVRMEYLE